MAVHDNAMSAAEYARLRGKPKVWVTRRIAAGLPATRVGREYRIDAGGAIEWELEQAAQAAVGANGSQRERLAKEQADRVALDNARRRGELIYSSHVGTVLATMAADLVARLDAVPGRCAGELAGIKDPALIRARLREEMQAVRGAFAVAVDKLADSIGAPKDGPT